MELLLISLAAWGAFILTIFGALHIALGIIFGRFIARSVQHSKTMSVFEPRTAVLLSVRGEDPFLAETLVALTKQAFPNYIVRVIVDHEADPAWQVTQRFADSNPTVPFSAELLRERSRQRGLKCSALLQLFEQLPQDIEVIAFIDSDVVPNPNWLRDLVAPLQDPQVGVTSGSQWFEPSSKFGTLIRSIWNAGAVVPTMMLGHPWAGSCAMRRADMVRSDLLEKWTRSIIDDGPVMESLKSIGLRGEFVPQAMVINHEETHFGFCAKYIRRMLTWSRLFESTYFLTVIHAFMTGGNLALLLLVFVIGLANGAMVTTIVSGWGIVALVLGSWIGYLLNRNASWLAYNSGQTSKTPPPALTLWTSLGLGIAIPSTYLTYFWAAISALFVKEVRWRNVVYRLRGKYDVEMIEYAPYSITGVQKCQNQSI